MLIACKCVNLIAISGNNESELKFSKNNRNRNQNEEFERDLSESADGNLTVEEVGNVSGGGGGRGESRGDAEETIKFGVNLAALGNAKDSNKIYYGCVEFLRRAIGPINDLTETIAQNSLIYKVPIGQWSLYYCINCKTVTHAKHTSNGSYLINSTLLTNNEEINSLKERKTFSNVFGLIITNKQVGTTPSSLTISTGKQNVDDSYKHKNEIKNLTQHLNNQLQREIYETDERIRSYTEQQFALLKNYREKAEHEYQILVSLVNQVPEEFTMIDSVNTTTVTTPTTDISATNNVDNGKSLFTIKHQQVPSLDTPPATPDSTPMSIGNSPTFRNQTNIFAAISGNGRNQQYNMNSGPKTLDGDCLFELEDMETYPISTSNAMSDLEEAEDAEDALGELGIGIVIPKSQNIKQNNILARSLPINIAPVTEARFVPEEVDDELSDDNNVDIAASIKALAKSVHGDTVFGDLPRPRFSTQI